ncbi:uncharacterized protein LOC144451304 [Glandiceps talaboti]
MANKVYWTDQSYNWIMIADYDGNNVHPLIYTNLDRPRGLVVQPIQGYLYWCDLGVDAKIEKSSLNGDNREVMVSVKVNGNRNINQPSGLTIDYDENRLYWTDDGLDTIMSVDLQSPYAIREAYNGLRELFQFPFDITLNTDYLYVSDYNTNKLWIIPRTDVSVAVWVSFNFIQPIGLAFFSQSSQPSQSSPCLISNGGCDHLCVGDPNGHKCLCNYGHVLDTNGYTCILDTHLVPGHQILLSTSNNICRLPVDFGNANEPVTEICFHPGIQATAMDYDISQDVLYAYDQTSHSIVKTVLREGEIFDTLFNNVGEVQGLTVDWLAANLYWTESDTKAIYISDFDGLYKVKLISDNIDQPGDIIAHSGEKLLFWADKGSVPRIEKSSLSGRYRTNLVSTDMTAPTAIAIDYTNKRLFWIDSNGRNIESVSIYGHDRTTYGQGQTNLFGLATFQDHLYWTRHTTETTSTLVQFNQVQNTVVQEQVLSSTVQSIVVFDRTRQLLSPAPGPCDYHNGGCAEICIPTSSGAECVCSQPQSPTCESVLRCPSDFRSGSVDEDCVNIVNHNCSFHCDEYFTPTYDSVIHCQENGDWDIDTDTVCKLDVEMGRFLLVADSQGVIFQIDLLSPTLDYAQLPLSGVTNPIALDYDFEEGKVYWTDVTLKTINMALLDGTQQQVILSADIQTPDGLALDVQNRHLYWSDTGTDRIERANLDGSWRTVIIAENLEEPRAVIVDAEHYLLYWSDWGTQAKIERASLDGSSRQTIVSSDLGWPNGLALDSKEGKLYWCDALLEKIEYYILESNTRQVLISFTASNVHPFGLAVADDYIFWTDWTNNQLQMADKMTGDKVISVGHEVFERANDVHVYLLPNAIVTCPKSFMSGSVIDGCNNTYGSHCDFECDEYFIAVYHSSLFCQDNGQWDVDTDTLCQFGDIPSSFFLVADTQKGAIFMMDFESTSLDYIRLPVGEITNPIALDYDDKDEKVYWTDVTRRTINRASLNGDNHEVLLSVDIQVPDGLALDVDNRHLYWTDTGTDRIERANLDGSERYFVVSSSLEEPRAIIVDSVNNFLYWSDWGSNAKIERAALDGTNRVALVSSDLVWPNGLALDTTEGKLYWCDASIDKIEYLILNLNIRQVLVSLIDIHPFSLTIVGSYIYWTDWTKLQLQRTDKNSGSNTISIGPGIFQRPNDIHFYTHTSGLTSTLRSVLSTTIAGPSFTDCPEGETFEFKVSENSNLAYIHNIPIQAVDSMGQPITHSISDTVVSIPGTLEWTENTKQGIHVSVSAESNGNTAFCSFTIKVVDEYPPTVTCPPDIHKTTTKTEERVTWDDPVANDNVGLLQLYVDQTSNMPFSVGTHIVTVTATDLSGNTASCTFNVIIARPPAEDDCGDLDLPENGALACGKNDDTIRETFQCTVFCKDGYTAFRNIRLYTCIGGNWHPGSDKPPRCIRYRPPPGGSVITQFTFQGHCQNVTESEILSQLESDISNRSLCYIDQQQLCSEDSISWRCHSGLISTPRSVLSTTQSRSTTRQSYSSTTYRDVSSDLTTVTMASTTTMPLTNPTTTKVTTQSTLNPRVTTQSTLNPRVTTQSTLNPTVTTQSTLNPRVTTQSTLNPTVTTQSTLNPRVTTQSTLNPTVTTQSTLNPTVTTHTTSTPTLRITSPYSSVPSSTKTTSLSTISTTSSGTGLKTVISTISISNTVTTLPPTTPVRQSSITVHDKTTTSIITTSTHERSTSTVSGTMSSVSSSPTTVAGPSFTECPEGETFEFKVSENSSLAYIHNISIQAVDSMGQPITHSISDTAISIPGMLEWTNDSQHVSISAESNGNTAFCSFTIKVVDEYPPTVTCPRDIHKTTTKTEERVTWDDPVANDNVGLPRLHVDRTNNRQFSVGTHIVTVTATDLSGNTASCTFNVIIAFNAPPAEGNCGDLDLPENGALACGKNDDTIRETFQCTVFCKEGYKALGDRNLYTCNNGNWRPTSGRNRGRNEPPRCTRYRPPPGGNVRIQFIFQGACQNVTDSEIVSQLVSEINDRSLCYIDQQQLCSEDSISWSCGNETTRRKRSANFGDLVVEIKVEVKSNITIDMGDDEASEIFDRMQRNINQTISRFKDAILVMTFTVNGTTYKADPESFTVMDQIWSCFDGHISITDGCVPCPVGSYYDPSINDCTFCDVNMYQDKEAKLSCITCPDNLVTEHIGSYKESHCIDKQDVEESSPKSRMSLSIGLVVGGVAVIVIVIVIMVVCCRKPRCSAKRRRYQSERLDSISDHIMLT